MSKLAALAVSVGVLAVVATWIFFLPQSKAWNLQVWTAFIAWGCHFQSGGKFKGSRAAVVCMSFGAVVGMAAVLLAGKLGMLGQFAAPIAVGVGATVIVLASKVPWLETIPASVYGFAAIAGLILVGKVPATQAILPTVISIVIGALFGIASEVVANALTKKEAPAAAGAAA